MSIPYSYLKRFTAGAVFGVYMAYLVYFLNPQLDTDVPRVVTTAVVYAFIVGLLLGTFLWLLRLLRVRLFGRSETAVRQHGFGSVVAATALAAALYWMHLELFRIYLPRGAVRVLSKATIVTAVTAFVLFVIWFFERTASRRAARVLFACGVCVILASAVVLYQRRDGYRDTRREVVFAEAPPVASERPIIVVAMRGLPYDWLLTAFGEGLAPHLEAIHDRGYATRIEPFRTSSPKALWATLATGQLPSRHGVTGRFSYHTALNRRGERFTLLPGGVGFSGWGLIPPVERISPQLPAGESLAFWDCFGKMGLASTVVNWPGTTSRESANARVISDRTLRGEASPLRPATVAVVRSSAGQVVVDGRIAARLERLRPDVRARLLDAFRRDMRAGIIAAESVRSGNALTVVSLNSLDESLVALGAPGNELPERRGAPGDAVRANLILFDLVVDRLRQARPDAELIIVSPSAPAAPVVPASIVTAAEAIEELFVPGENDGFFIACGEGFVHRANPQPAEIADVVPTLFFAANLPLARDLDGALLIEPFAEEVFRTHAATFISSYRAEKFEVRR